MKELTGDTHTDMYQRNDVPKEFFDYIEAFLTDHCTGGLYPPSATFFLLDEGYLKRNCECFLPEAIYDVEIWTKFVRRCNAAAGSAGSEQYGEQELWRKLVRGYYLSIMIHKDEKLHPVTDI